MYLYCVAGVGWAMPTLQMFQKSDRIPIHTRPIIYTDSPIAGHWSLVTAKQSERCRGSGKLFQDCLEHEKAPKLLIPNELRTTRIRQNLVNQSLL
ncbi:hypothetical protein NUACC26_081180 [Scytonema sp. NUACC26]